MIRTHRFARVRRRPRAASILALAIATLVACTMPAWSQPRSEIIRERLKTRPDDPTLWYFLAGAEFEEGDKASGLVALERLAAIGNGFLPVRDVGFGSVWNDTAFQRLRRQLEQKLPRVTAARERFRLDRQLIPEGIAYDPERRSYFVGSIAASKIVRVDSAGAVSDVSRPGELRHVLGLAVDAGARRLHAVSATLTAAPREAVRNRVVSYDLDRGTLTRSVDVPQAVQLNDLAVSPEGDLFVTDSGAGGVYRVRASGSVDTLVAPGSVPGVNGIARSPDGAALYLAHATGVARFDLATKELLPRIEVPKGETIAAIDGLYADGNTLIGIQNVTNPGRVIRIHLRAGGKAAERIETLLSHHHPALDEPTTGAIVGRSLMLLATTQVARFTPEGRILSPETLKPPVVLEIALPPVPGTKN